MYHKISPSFCSWLLKQCCRNKNRNISQWYVTYTQWSRLLSFRPVRNMRKNHRSTSVPDFSFHVIYHLRQNRVANQNFLMAGGHSMPFGFSHQIHTQNQYNIVEGVILSVLPALTILQNLYCTCFGESPE